MVKNGRDLIFPESHPPLPVLRFGPFVTDNALTLRVCHAMTPIDKPLFAEVVEMLH